MNRLTKVIAAVLMALAAILAIAAWWMGRQPPATSTQKNIAVAEAPSYLTVVASRKLEKGKEITLDDVKLMGLPMQTSGSYEDIASVVGRVPMNDMESDTPITEASLVHGLALKLAEGERAVAIPVDETVGVGNKIEVGDYVDVFFTLKGGSDRGQARLLASRVRVLAYGAAVIGETPAKNALPTPPSQQQQARTAVLAASVDQINPLLLAVQNGKLTLALRHPGDAGTADIALFPQAGNVLLPKAGLSSEQRASLQSADNRAFSGIDMSSWSGENNARPAISSSARPTSGASPPSGSLEVIKGTQREKVSF